MYKKIEVFNASISLTLRRVRDSNPRYDVMRTPHLECGTFDHSVNSPCFSSKAGAKVLLFFQIRKYLRIFLSLYLHFIKSGTEHTAYIGN